MMVNTFMNIHSIKKIEFILIKVKMINFKDYIVGIGFIIILAVFLIHKIRARYQKKKNIPDKGKKGKNRRKKGKKRKN